MIRGIFNALVDEVDHLVKMVKNDYIYLGGGSEEGHSLNYLIKHFIKNDDVSIENIKFVENKKGKIVVTSFDYKLNLNCNIRLNVTSKRSTLYIDNKFITCLNFSDRERLFILKHLYLKALGFGFKA